ncbi:radical SAM protein, partial [Faecalibaculum rodentium]|uniref:radical SAM protein n=1 Tax=Faecalibaculum rodentium TaxID=1702221 RepID=UPI0025B05693
MTKETVEQSIKFIKSMKSKRLNITWYGGEPTLCIDIIEEFTKKLRESFGSDNLNSTIVSNGYLLDRSLAIRLKECGVSAVQITIDGPKHIHDMRRKLKSGEGTFEKILKNIEEIFSILQVTIRVNVDKTNLKNAMDLLSYLNEKGILNKANFYLAPINETDQVRNANCINPMEFAQLERQLYKSYSPNKYREIPRATFGLCGAVSPNSFIISSNGKLYKCWDEIGRENSEIGSVYDGITNPDVYFS